jgi:hypothetical protein
LYLVVLGLVELESLDSRHRGSKSVDAEAKLENPIGIGRIDELWSDDTGVLPECLFDHSPSRVRSQHDVVMAEQEVTGAFDDPDHGVGSRAKARVRVQSAEIEIRGNPRNAVGERWLTRLVDDEYRKPRIVLFLQGSEALFQPGSGIVRYDDRDDRWRKLLRHGASGYSGQEQCISESMAITTTAPRAAKSTHSARANSP